jgi:hypothetical protein
MANRFFCFIFFILISQLSSAQLADGSVAPNITGVDLEGNRYDLHEILDSGRGVVIEISATWCSPCYTVHKTRFLDLIHETYGPGGTNELVVLFLEGDDGTDLDDLKGTGDKTAGDWTSCTKVPILDDMHSAKSEYQISYWGTYFVINPIDKTTKWFNFFNNDKLKPYLVDIGLIDLPQKDASMGFLCDEGPQYICSEANTFIPKLDLYNLGSKPLTTVSFDILIDNKYHSSQNWSGNISSFESEQLKLNPIPVAGPSEIAVIINQEGDSNLTNNKKIFNIQLSPKSTQNEVTVEIKTDEFAPETYWQIEDDMGNIIASGGNTWVGTTNIGIGFGASAPQTPQGTYMENQIYTEIVKLDSSGCYNFVITDYYGGGIKSDLGGYKVTDHLGRVLFAGAKFDDIVVHPFLNGIISTTTNDPSKNINLSLFPNPVYDQLNITMDLNQADISIFDHQGREVYQNQWNQYPIEISNFSNGLYILKVSTNGKYWTQRFVKQ